MSLLMLKMGFDAGVILWECPYAPATLRTPQVVAFVAMARFFHTNRLPGRTDTNFAMCDHKAKSETPNFGCVKCRSHQDFSTIRRGGRCAPYQGMRQREA
jgi:hypothetical protein